MDKITLSAQKRSVVGKKVRRLRKEGMLPANVYGKKVKSAAVTVSLADFDKVYKKAGETGLIELKVGGEIRPVLIHNIQLDPVKMSPMHADFYQVDLKEKVAANVSIELVGEAPAVAAKTGVLLTLLDEIEVEALPRDLPEKIIVKVDHLSVVDQVVKVSDLMVDKAVKILTPLDREVVKVAPLVSKEAEKMAAEEEAAKAAAAAEAAAAAGPAEGGAPAPAPATEEKKPAPAAGPPAGRAGKEEKEPPKAPPAK
ncbi:50S ribosomal protein L25 [Candidatus Gottesmanbacteria bacterium]|nr:50S ribosomal protein L25 [Candidatus Gottesmanbacteria bacterium]